MPQNVWGLDQKPEVFIARMRTCGAPAAQVVEAPTGNRGCRWMRPGGSPDRLAGPQRVSAPGPGRPRCGGLHGRSAVEPSEPQKALSRPAQPKSSALYLEGILYSRRELNPNCEGATGRRASLTNRLNGIVRVSYSQQPRGQKPPVRPLVCRQLARVRSSPGHPLMVQEKFRRPAHAAE